MINANKYFDERFAESKLMYSEMQKADAKRKEVEKTKSDLENKISNE